MSTEVKVPVLGESITEATIGEWLKQPGDTVDRDEPIASLETDKVALEVPAPVAGTMGPLMFEVGDTVNVDQVIASIEASDGNAAKSAGSGAAKKAKSAPEKDAADTAGPASDASAAPAGADAVLVVGGLVKADDRDADMVLAPLTDGTSCPRSSEPTIK